MELESGGSRNRAGPSNSIQNFAEAYRLHSFELLALNRGDDAVEAQRKAQALDPFARPWALGAARSIALGKSKEAEN